jgi:lipopolysaccharide export system protein LptC
MVLAVQQNRSVSTRESAQSGIVMGATPQERRRAYNRARRHTVLVRLLRWTLPAGAVACLGLYALPNKVRVELVPGGPVLSFDNVSLSSQNLKMTRPHFDGYTPDQAYYEVGAASAVQNFGLTATAAPGTTEDVTLEKIEAKLTQPDTSWVKMNASAGVMRIKAQTMRMTGGINVATSQNMTVKLLSADVDFNTKRLASDEAVAIAMPTGTVTATGLDVDVDGKVITFRSGVAARMTGNGTPPQPSSTPSPGTGAFGALENQSGPIDITAARLEIRDAEKTAVFSGGVVAQRPDSTLTGDTMTVTYANRAGAPQGAAAFAGSAPADIENLAVTGPVALSAADGRTATADTLRYDRPAGTLALIGNVTVAQAGNVLKGGRIDIDIKARRTKVSGPGRVTGHFEQAAAELPAKKAARPAAGPVAGIGSGIGGAGTGPIEVAADQLEVLDERGIATFRGNVIAERGGQQIKAGQLELTYVTAASGAASADSRLKRMEARDRVSVRAPDGQVITGDRMVYEAGASVIAVNGNVVVNNGKSVATVPQLVIDLNTGEVRFNTGSTAGKKINDGKTKTGRVQVMIDTSDGEKLLGQAGAPTNAEASASAAQRPAAKTSQKPAKKSPKPAAPALSSDTQP